MYKDFIEHGVFSAEEKKITGSWLCESLDNPGKYVELTHIFYSQQEIASHPYTDKVSVGRIGEYIKQLHPGICIGPVCGESASRHVDKIKRVNNQ
jgi:hypothetical protein